MNTSHLLLLKLEQMKCCTELCRNRIHWDDLVVSSESFGCKTALENSNC